MSKFSNVKYDEAVARNVAFALAHKGKVVEQKRVKPSWMDRVKGKDLEYVKKRIGVRSSDTQYDAKLRGLLTA